MKILRKDLLEKQAGAAAFTAEVSSLRAVGSHPNVIQVVDVKEGSDAVYCVLELAENGEVNEYIGAVVIWAALSLLTTLFRY